MSCKSVRVLIYMVIMALSTLISSDAIVYTVVVKNYLPDGKRLVYIYLDSESKKLSFDSFEPNMNSTVKVRVEDGSDPQFKAAFYWRIGTAADDLRVKYEFVELLNNHIIPICERHRGDTCTWHAKDSGIALYDERSRHYQFHQGWTVALYGEFYGHLLRNMPSP